MFLNTSFASVLDQTSCVVIYGNGSDVGTWKKINFLLYSCECIRSVPNGHYEEFGFAMATTKLIIIKQIKTTVVLQIKIYLI